MNRLKRLQLLLPVIWKLGPKDVLAVGLYKLRLGLGIHPAQHLKAELAKDWTSAPADANPPGGTIPTRLFGWREVAIESASDWDSGILGNVADQNTNLRWDRALDQFPSEVDIKEIWELSRLYCIVELAWLYRGADAQKRDVIIAQINWVMRSWINRNPPCRGLNWSCGQEASIRSLHLLQALLILGHDSKRLEHVGWFLDVHRQRIDASIAYGLAQRNNHGSTESAALFCIAVLNDDGAGIAKGRRRLNRCAFQLIQEDGGPSQYSVTYHRAVLSALVFCEIYARGKGLRCFSDPAVERIVSGADWLRALTEPVHGDAPNWGANDGNFILQLPVADYRDFRPLVELVYCALAGQGAFGDELIWPEIALAYGLPPPTGTVPPPVSRENTQTGLAVLKHGNVLATLHSPSFSFRPSQSDILHCDLWVSDLNLLRDSGSYSYRDATYSSVRHHNTIEFDGREQMPRIGKFLYGAWPQRTHSTFKADLAADRVNFSSGYVDAEGCRHKRSISISSSTFRCVDEISGFRASAILRWQLPRSAWRFAKGEVVGSVNGMTCRYSMLADGEPVALELVQGSESRYYLGKKTTTIIQATFTKPATIVTELHFGNDRAAN